MAEPDLSGAFSSLKSLWRTLAPTDEVAESGFRCYRKPNRTVERHFTAQDAARVMCYAFKRGASEADMIRRFRVHCRGETRERANVAEEAIALAMEGVQLNTQQLLDEWRAFLIVNGILIGLIALLGVIQIAGPLRLVAQPLRLGARVAQTQVAQIITMNITRRAANDRLFQQLQEALRQAA